MPEGEQRAVYVNLPAEDVEWLEEHYGYGAKTRFIRLFLRKFREVHESVPKDKVDQAIEEMGFG